MAARSFDNWIPLAFEGQKRSNSECRGQGLHVRPIGEKERALSFCNLYFSFVPCSPPSHFAWERVPCCSKHGMPSSKRPILPSISSLLGSTSRYASYFSPFSQEKVVLPWVWKLFPSRFYFAETLPLLLSSLKRVGWNKFKLSHPFVFPSNELREHSPASDVFSR